MSKPSKRSRFLPDRVDVDRLTLDLSQIERIFIYYGTRKSDPSAVVEARLCFEPRASSEIAPVTIPIEVGELDATRFAIEARRVMEASRFPNVLIEELRAVRARVSQSEGVIEHAWVLHRPESALDKEASDDDAPTNKVADGDDDQDGTSVSSQLRSAEERETVRRDSL